MSCAKNPFILTAHLTIDQALASGTISSELVCSSKDSHLSLLKPNLSRRSTNKECQNKVVVSEQGGKPMKEVSALEAFVK